MNVETPVEALKPNDYASDQEVDGAPAAATTIIKGVHRTLAELQIPLEKLVFFSGIGCAASSLTTWPLTAFTPFTAAPRACHRCETR